MASELRKALAVFRAMLVEELGAEQGSELHRALLAATILMELRQRGWMVAVHNDYKQGGEHMTFWLMTKGNVAFKGEGANDMCALSELANHVVRYEDETRVRTEDA